MLYDIFLGLSISFSLFTMYVYFNIDNIIFRPDSEGKYIFTPSNLFRLMFHPLRDRNFWKTDLWSANYFIYLIFIWTYLYIIKSYSMLPSKPLTFRDDYRNII